MTVTELSTMLLNGLYRVFLTNFSQTDDVSAKIKPEYMTTVLIANSLVERYGGIGSSIQVRMEDATHKILGASIGFPRRTGWHKEISRPGRVDVVLYVSDGVPRPVVLIEAKRFVRTYSAIEKDTKRLIEFLQTTNENNESTIAACASTFFLLEERNLTVASQRKLCETRLRTMLTELMKIVPSGLQVEVRYRTLLAPLYKTVDEAMMLDENGQRKYAVDAPISIFGIVIIIYREDRNSFLSAIKAMDDASPLEDHGNRRIDLLM